MHQLPPITDVDAANYPELCDIFRSIDAGIAAIVAADPAFRAKSAHTRREPVGRLARRPKGRSRIVSRAAA